MALAWDLLPNKSTATYKEMFGALCDAFINMFGDAGRHTFLIDFETAAINAIQSTFPASMMKECNVGPTFHFRQAVTPKVQCNYMSPYSTGYLISKLLRK